MAEPQGFSFDNWLTSPTFQMGASVLGAPNIGVGLTQGAQSAQAMALSRAKMQGLVDQQNQARRRQEAWNNIFPNGQPNTQHPLLKNVPPEIAALAATYGPDEGLSALQQYQFGREKSALAAAAANRAAELHPYEIAKMKAETDRIKADAESGKTSLTPIYGYDADGNAVVMQPNSRGEAVKTKMPDGVTVSRPPIKVDTGTEIQFVDPVTRQVVRTMPKDVQAAEALKEAGKAEGKKGAVADNVIANAEIGLKTIEQLRNHPGRKYATGALAAVGTLPGTSARGFVGLLDQVKGQAFLDVYDALRGAGQISNAEGDKAQAARARLDRAQTKEDFDAALDDLNSIIKSGLERAKASKAKIQGYQSTARSAAPATSDGFSIKRID